MPLGSNPHGPHRKGVQSSCGLQNLVGKPLEAEWARYLGMEPTGSVSAVQKFCLAADCWDGGDEVKGSKSTVDETVYRIAKLGIYIGKGMTSVSKKLAEICRQDFVDMGDLLPDGWIQKCEKVAGNPIGLMR